MLLNSFFVSTKKKIHKDFSLNHKNIFLNFPIFPSTNEINLFNKSSKYKGFLSELYDLTLLVRAISSWWHWHFDQEKRIDLHRYSPTKYINLLNYGNPQKNFTTERPLSVFYCCGPFFSSCLFKLVRLPLGKK